ncbi:MAG: DUF1822 family protein [Symploca sp. SIO1C2]|nr:DUF1822 family protein [Symploca sp. SIO1C2]
MFSLDKLINTYPKQLCLELSPQAQAQAWQQVHNYSNDVARWRAYVNYLCLHSFVDWLQEEPDFQEEKLSIWPNNQANLGIWEMVNGCALELGDTRLVLIPSETTDLEQLCVPAEWLDIPNWAADYYLAVQVNLEGDEDWMRVWGFTTYDKLKQGKKDTLQHTYSLDSQDLIESLNILWVGREVCPEEKPTVAPLPTLETQQAKQLLTQLSKPTPYSPRLTIPFEHWAALLANEQWRQQLYDQRLRQSRVISSSVEYLNFGGNKAEGRGQKAEGKKEENDNCLSELDITASSQAPVSLRQWLEGIVESGWQAAEALLVPLELSPVRGSTASPETVTLDTITPVIRLLQPDQPEKIRYQAAGVLGEIGTHHPEAIAALQELLHNAQEEETRWQAALSLGKIDPGNPEAGVRKARLIDLGMQLGSHTIALIVAIMPRVDDRISVFVQVQPAGKLLKLPPHLKLSVLSASGETKLEVEARSDEQEQGKDKSLEGRFSPPPGTRFRVRVGFDDVSVTEDFIA